MKKRTISFRGKSAVFGKPIVKGSKVLLSAERYVGSGASNPVVGSKFECEGVVQAVSPEDGGIVAVQWANETSNTYRTADLVDMAEFMDAFPPYSEELGFKVNDVVYIKHTINKTPSVEWPMVSSNYEIDCKVLTVYDSPLRLKRTYELISGHGYRMLTTDDYIISVADRDALFAGGIDIYEAQEDALPLFAKGDKFKKIVNYYVSMDDAVSIENSKGNKLFKLCTSSDKQSS